MDCPARLTICALCYYAAQVEAVDVHSLAEQQPRGLNVIHNAPAHVFTEPITCRALIHYLKLFP
jgi:hypothetical protein